MGLLLLVCSDSEGACELGGCETGVPFGVSDAEMLCVPGKKKTKHNIIANWKMTNLIHQRNKSEKKILAQVSNPKP